ncbi:MAG: glycosyl hydrolase 53 family protein [Lachnospiraceae bacterium]|nr:glycosyl hydrolase 53 family protein [Lachnospiraceae bacterium]
MKRYRKKLLALCISASLVSATLAGCGSKNTTSAETPQSTVTTESATETVCTEATLLENTVTDAASTPNVEQIDVTTFPLPDASEESSIYLEPISGISDDFIRGMDASAVLVNENSGVTYYNYDGEEQDVFMTLAQSGVNYIRLRVWNDPYDENGNGYGGGNNDVPTAIELGKRATKYGMKVCIDFHYSDFWADPKRQHAPKAWEGMSADEKCDALYDFTKESLSEILDAGVNVGMVQIGNEINNGMSGETLLPSVMNLLSSGSRAVREISETYGKDIQIAVHYTDINEADKIDRIAMNLLNFGVDYDIFAMSYYPFWHGTPENMQTVAQNIQEKYGKKVVIAETSYCYTSEDGDGCGNNISGNGDLVEGYAATVQSQATIIRDICAAANEVGVLGIFYWEGTWIPVGKATADNSPIWEKYGSGWASSFAGDYDPDDAGLYYGGCSWDNQAMFDFDGHPLASLNVFKYLEHGTTAPLAIDFIPELYLSCNVGSKITLPETIDVIYNDRSVKEQAAVTWDEAQLTAIDTTIGGTYEVTGTLEDGTTVTCYIDVIMMNFVQNPSFEDTDTSMWNITYAGEKNPTDFQKKTADAHSGDTAYHFWSEADMEFAIEQEFTNLEPGTYQLIAYAQGGDMSTDSVLELYAITNDEEKTASFMVNGYANWQEPTISEIKVTDGTLTIGVRMSCNAKSWGTVDDFTLNRISD